MKNFLIACSLILVACNYSKEEGENSTFYPKRVDIFMGNKLQSTEYYNRENNLIEKINSTFIAVSVRGCEITDTTIRWVYTYENNKLISEEEFLYCKREVHKRTRYIYEYDEKEQMHKKIEIDSSKFILNTSLYSYYDKYIIETNFDSQDNINYIDTTINFEKDSFSLVVFGDAAMKYHNLYSYNAAGDLIKWQDIMIKNNIDTVRKLIYSYLYNEHGFIREIYLNANGREEIGPYLTYKYEYYE